MENTFRDIAAKNIDFNTLIPQDIKLIETCRWEPGKGIIRKDLHKKRLLESCQHFGIPVEDIMDLDDCFTGDLPLRIRILVCLAGKITIQSYPYVPLPLCAVWRVQLAQDFLDPEFSWLRYKTSYRALHDKIRQDLPDGIDEAIFINTRGELCEGTITNIFLEREGRFFTPAQESGLLPGVLREEMLQSGLVHEKILTLEDLRQAGHFWVGNSLRGLIRAELVLDA